MSAPPPKVAPWEDVVLRIIAIYKLAKTVLFIAIGVGLIRIMHHNMADMLRVYVLDPMHFDPENTWVQSVLEKASLLTKHQIEAAGFVAFFYAIIFATEGFGLYFRKHWAEYMVLISTGLLLPFEFWEIGIHVAWWKIAITIGNVAILLYLAHRLWLDYHTKSGRGDKPGGDNLGHGDKSHPPKKSDSRQDRAPTRVQ
jgi:uncharacterized membrane protein (DUF2068 family)